MEHGLPAAPIPPGRQGGVRQLSSSLNSNGLLSQKMASSESNGHLPNGNGNGGCASRQSSECSDEERPGSSSGSAKVGPTCSSCPMTASKSPGFNVHMVESFGAVSRHQHKLMWHAIPKKCCCDCLHVGTQDAVGRRAG